MRDQRRRSDFWAGHGGTKFWQDSRVCHDRTAESVMARFRRTLRRALANRRIHWRHGVARRSHSGARRSHAPVFPGAPSGGQTGGTSRTDRTRTNNRNAGLLQQPAPRTRPQGREEKKNFILTDPDRRGAWAWGPLPNPSTPACPPSF